jgi:myosin protein heavy chain
VRRSLTDAEKVQAKIAAERDNVLARLKEAELKLQELESRLDQGSQDSEDMSVLRQRLAQETEDERKQYQKDLEERDFAADQTRKKYQSQ